MMYKTKEVNSFLPIIISRGIQTLIAILVVVLLTIPPKGNNVVIALDNPKNYNIGAVLHNKEDVATFYQAITDITSERSILPPGVTLYGVTVPMIPNPIRIAQSVCDKLISVQVYAVIVGRPSAGELSPASVSYTCGFYNIPVFGISSRDSSLSDKNLHASFLRTVPPFSHQADVWIELLKFLKYNSVVFIHSSDNDGRSTLGRFQTLADNASIKVESFIEYEPGITDIAQELEEKTHLFCRVFVLYANVADAEGIFREIDQLNMTSPGYVWFVSEQALQANNRPEGIVGIRLADPSSQGAHIIDSVQVIATGLKDLYENENITSAPQDCNNLGRIWDTGLKFASYLKRQTIYGKTGRVSFDDKGDRLYSGYEILNWVGDKLVEVGQFTFSKEKSAMVLKLNDNDIIWPGNVTTKPPGYIIPKHLKVITIEEKPFVWTRAVHSEEECSKDEIPCPKRNATDDAMGNYCCRGYCMDLLKKLSEDLNFTYDLRQVEDGQYGSFDYVNGSKRKIWTGMVGELVLENADMIVAPLTINPERSEVIEFSKPFKYQGITILEKKQPKSSTLASFLQPFQHTLWIVVMVSVHVVAVALYLLDRFSPFGRYKLPNSDATEEDALNLSSAIWFAWGVLLNSGIGEGTPRSFSARVLGMVWAGFAMIVVASYTANLAAFLVLDRPETSLTGINDARLRNPMDNFVYATVKGSSVDMYFRRQVELSNMYRTMEGKNYATAEEAITAVKSGELNAFIWDSSRLEYEAAQDCDLVTAGEQFGRSGYGIGLQRRSFWAERVTLALLRMHESGDMEKLDHTWIMQGNEKCDNKNEKFPATLGLKNMAGVFILVGAGIVGGVGLIMIEIVYKKQQTKKLRRMEAARSAADRWRGTVERKTLRANLLIQKRPKSNGMEAFTVERGMRGLSATPIATSAIAPGDLDPIPPPPPPRSAPPVGILPSILTVDIPPNDPDIHGIPPPPPPPSSSPAVRMRGRRVVYASRNRPEYESRDAPV